MDAVYDELVQKELTSQCNTAKFRSCVKVEVAVLGSLSLIVLMVSVDVKQHTLQEIKIQT